MPKTTWTAILLDAGVRDGHGYFSILYSDGQSKHVTEYRAEQLTDDVVKAAARAEVAKVTTIDVTPLTLEIGQPIDLTPPAVEDPPQDPAVIARDAFFDLWHRYQRQQMALTAGLVPPDAPDLITLDEVKKAFDPAYVRDL